MYYVVATYTDGKFVECLHVTEISYNGANALKTVTADEIPSHKFPIGKTLWLKTNNGCISIAGDSLRVIEIRSE